MFIATAASSNQSDRRAANTRRRMMPAMIAIPATANATARVLPVAVA